MIKRLYRKYRLQIIFAFVLVIFENMAYIAEPYVFGKAIDGLREARQIEEEVDSSLTTLQMRQIADSVRAHVLDSIRSMDSIKIVDSVRALDEESYNQDGSSDQEAASTLLAFREIAITRRRLGSPNSSIFHFALFRQQDPLDTASPEQWILPKAQVDSVRRKIAQNDSARSKASRKKSLLGLKRDVARDSLRKQIKEHPPAPAHAGGTQPERPLGFYVPREVGPFLPPLIPWVLLFIINSSLGAFRRIYDTRLYTKMFASLSSDVVARQLALGEDLSKIAARSSMAWHNIEFFQYNVPEFLEQLIAVGGAVIALGLFDWRLTVVGSILIIFVTFGSRFYMRSVQEIQVALHDRYEDEYNVFGTRDPKQIRQYYSDIADLEIKQSKRSTASYSVIRVFLLVMFLTTLYISIDLDRFTIGALYSIVAYVWSFVTATEYIPYLSEKWVALKDASRRIAVAGPSDDESLA